MKGDLNFKPKIIFITSAIFYLLIGLWSGFFGWRNPDTGWIASVASLFTLDPYSYYRLIGVAPPLGMGFGFTPLLLYLIQPFIILGNQMGWTNEFIAKIYVLPLLLVDTLNIYLIIRMISLHRPGISKANLNFIILILFFSGYFLFTSGYMGHPETLVLLFALLGIGSLRQKKLFKSGIFFGLALFAKQSAVFILIPTFFYLYLQQGGPQRSFKFLIATIATFLLLMAPFFIAHPANTWYGIVGFSQYLVLRGPNIWWFIDAFSRIMLNVGWVNQFLIKIANVVLLIAAILASITLLKQKKVKFDDQGLFGLISIILLFFNIFSKWISFHHFLLGFVFVMLWDTLRTKEGFPVFGVTYAFSLVVASFIGNPLWQLWVLGINILAFAYLWYLLARSR